MPHDRPMSDQPWLTRMHAVLDQRSGSTISMGLERRGSRWQAGTRRRPRRRRSPNEKRMSVPSRAIHRETGCE